MSNSSPKSPRPCDQAGQQVDAERHVAGLDDPGVERRRLQLGEIVRRQAGGADHVDDAGLGGEFGVEHRRGRRREVEDAVGLGEDGQRIVGDRDAPRRQPGEHARILAERRRPLALDRAGERAALGAGHGLDQHPPHAPEAPTTTRRMDHDPCVGGPGRARLALAAHHRTSGPRTGVGEAAKASPEERQARRTAKSERQERPGDGRVRGKDAPGDMRGTGRPHLIPQCSIAPELPWPFGSFQGGPPAAPPAAPCGSCVPPPRRMPPRRAGPAP